MRAGDRDVRRQNAFAAGAVIASLDGARQASTSIGVVIPASPNVMSPFVATDLAFRDAVLQLPAQRLGDEWSYAGRALRPGGVTTFYGPNYELRGTILSVNAGARTRAMKQTEDQIALGVIERSTIVIAVERAATRLGHAVKTSHVLQAARPIARAAGRHRGVTILTAVATHVALVGVVVRPASWYWLMIPALAAAAGAVLVAWSRPEGGRGE